ncbi:MAG: type II secretion system protein GspL [Janthinobacterium lividum]
MSTLYIRLPSRSVAENASHWITLPCPYALVAGTETVEREGHAALSDLAGMLAAAQRVVLLLAASDVTLLHVKVPPMAPARLRVALPNLVEDQLMSDPADCAMVAGASIAGLRTVAVVQRKWLQILLQTVGSLGARNVVAVPSQLCLTHPAAGIAAAVTRFGDELDLTLRLSEQDGLGLPLLPDGIETAAQDVIETICALVPTASISLYVAQEEAPAYQRATDVLLPLEQRVTIYSDNWTRWIEGARMVSINLVAALAGTGGATLDWRRWRWPLALGSLLLLLNIGALNFEWWRLSREAAQLRLSMVQIYRTAYPKETVIVDPAAQMRQKIAAARRDAGQPAPDDFAALAAGFGAAWSSVTQNAPAAGKAGIAGVEYRDRSLFVKPKPEVDISLAQMKSALAARGLTLAQSQPGVWQIRSEK